MRKWEILCTEFAKRYTKAWDYFIVSTDSYSKGYHDALEHGKMEEVVEREIVDAQHQLSVRSFFQWEKENKSLSLKEAMKIYLIHFDITELRVDNTEGLISFQGIARRKD